MIVQATHDHDGHCSGQGVLIAGRIAYSVVCDDCHAIVRPLESVPYPSHAPPAV